jgi:hypothetical protein
MRFVLLASIVVLQLVPRSSLADTAHEATFWTGYLGSLRPDPFWRVNFDVDYNVDTFFMLRGDATRVFDAGPSVSVGYAFLLQNPSFERQEHRPWLQAFAPYQLSDAWSVSGRFRMEFRFRESLANGQVASGYDFALRTRLQGTLTHRFRATRIGQPLIQLSDEVLVNAAADPDLPVFDQNRLSLLVGLRMGGLTVRTGYMNQYFPNARGGNGRFEHVAMLRFTQAFEIGDRKPGAKQPKYDYEEYPEFDDP